MLCQECKERPATVHFTKIVAGEKSEFHLCEQCAAEKGDFFAKAAQAFNFNHLLSGLLNMESSPGVPATQPALRCQSCGMSYSQFTELGRFGCPDCYDSFASRLDPLLRRIQSSESHAGKVPVRAGEQVQGRKELQKLRQELQRAVALENFEEAAQLRDKIRNLEQTLAGQEGH
ncbi:UvrB/UvrC motif-containing protein [Alicyclobacillus curvatus]|jgi:protein arginine kinase activator|nr:UvrB/UvrC motif-containing protein [Alicyclobacillus curvatus]